MKNKYVALIICILFGYLGVHRFCVGKIKSGILYLFTAGLFGIGWIVDIILILTDKFIEPEPVAQTSQPAAQFILTGGIMEITPTTMSAANAQLKEPYVVLDFETTGLNPQTDKIIEVGAVKVVDGNVTEFTSLVNPLVSLPAKITEITGLRDKDLKNAPTIDAVLPRLDDFLSDCIIVAHNASFDLKFYCAAHGSTTVYKSYIDTVKLAKKAFPGSENYKLETLVKNLNIPRGTAHRALGDARMTLYEKALKVIARVQE